MNNFSSSFRDTSLEGACTMLMTCIKIFTTNDSYYYYNILSIHEERFQDS